MIDVDQTGLFSCSMKDECGLQCRCSSEDLTPYIIVISRRYWVLLGYLIHFLPKAHANQAPTTGIKAGGSPAHVWLEGAVGSAAVNMVTPNLRERAGGRLSSLARAAALGSERSCCGGLWCSRASWELALEAGRAVAGRCGQHGRATRDFCLAQVRWEP